MSACIRYGCIGSSHASARITIHSGERGREMSMRQAYLQDPACMISHGSYSHSMSKTKPYKGPNMEGPIATWYARITKRDRGYAQIADDLAARLPRGARVLEVAPGPGYLAVELARRGL